MFPERREDLGRHEETIPTGRLPEGAPRLAGQAESHAQRFSIGTQAGVSMFGIGVRPGIGPVFTRTDSGEAAGSGIRIEPVSYSIRVTARGVEEDSKRPRGLGKTPEQVRRPD